MTKNTLMTRPAGSAVAAALALIATPSLAQDTTTSQPEILIPSIPNAPVVIDTTTALPDQTAAPQIVIPDSARVEAVTVAPQVESEPMPTVASTVPVAARTSTSPRQVAPADPSPLATQDFDAAAQSADIAVVDDGAAEEGAAALAAAATATDRPISTGNESADDSGTMVMAGGAAAIGFGLIGLFMAGAARRRRRDRLGVATDRTVALERPAHPLRRPVATPLDETGSVTPEFANSTTGSPGRSKWDDSGYVNASPALGAIPSAKLAQDPDARRAMLDRLVRARPDEANPFRSPKARRRRARLIMQTLGQRLKEQPNLDFTRFYRSFGRRTAVMA